VDDRPDASGMYDTKSGSFTITGSNDAPVISLVDTHDMTEN
jgi:VCBS repeat-containing protein